MKTKVHATKIDAPITSVSAENPATINMAPRAVIDMTTAIAIAIAMCLLSSWLFFAISVELISAIFGAPATVWK